MNKIDVQFQKLVDWAQLPAYETTGAAGCDLSLALREEMVLYPHEVQSISTGFAMRIPDGYEAQIRSRAGMARKGIIVANATGTIDADHLGEVKVLLVNIGNKPIKVVPGQKVAQMVFSPVVQAQFQEA